MKDNPFLSLSIPKDPFSLVVWAIIIFLIAGFAAIAVSIAIPIAIAVGLFFAIRWYMRLPKPTGEIHQAVEMQRTQAQFPDVHEFFRAYSTRYDADCATEGLTPGGYNFQYAMLNLAVALYDAEGFTETKMPMRGVIEGSVPMGEYRDGLMQQAKKVADPYKTMDVFTRSLSEAFVGVTSCLPEIATEKHDTAPAEDSGITVSLLDALGEDALRAIQYVMGPFFKEETTDLHLFETTRAQLERNFDEIDSDDFVPASKFKGTPAEAVDAYLKFTPLKELFAIQVPWALPQQMRFEHQWIVAPQGAGKTQLIQYQITRDIEEVRAGEASVVVMDSQGDLINLISRLDSIPPDKLIVIEPDPVYPLALNPFDVGKDRLATYDARTREMLDNSAIELLSYVFDNLLGTATTQKQTALFQNVIRLCRVLPEANIKTLSEILGMQGVPFPEYVDQLPEVSRDFFHQQFADPKQFKDTKTELAWRLSLLRGNNTFERMFSQKRSKIDLFQELNSSKVVLINTDKMLLKDKGTELFGRFFIALLLQASQERAALERSKRKPTYVYIDECQDYISNDSKITTILDQARKMNMGVVLAHQRTAQMDKNVLDALTNVGIKCARAVNDAGSHVLARNMATTPEFIAKQPTGYFAIALRNNPAMSIRIPPFVMEKMPKITEPEMTVLKKRMRDKYAVEYAPTEKSPPNGGPKPPRYTLSRTEPPRDTEQPSHNPQDETKRPGRWPMK